MRLGAFKATLAGAAKSLRCTAIGFHLRHYKLLRPDPCKIAGEGGPRTKSSTHFYGQLLQKSRQLFLFWRHNHDQLPPFHFWKLLDSAIVFKVFLNPFQELDAKLLMGHFSTTIAQGHLDPISFPKEINQLSQLNIVITNVSAGPEFYFLNLNLLGFRFSRLRFFLLFKKIFTEIHDAANGRLRIRGYFDEIQRDLFGFGNSIL